MADQKQQKTSQHLEKNAENLTAKNSIKFGFFSEDVRKIYVGGLKKEITEKDLSVHFGQFGEIKYVDVKVDIATGQSRGYAFVVFRTVEGVNNALACKNHVINDMKIEPKKAIPRRVKLFVGGLPQNLTDKDIIDYFKRYTHDVQAEMPFDKVKNQRKSFCFVTIENLEAVTEILRLPRHVIMGKQVDVKVADIRVENNGMMPGFSRPVIGMQGNVMGQGGFLPQSGYAFYAPGYHYGGNGYYVPYTGYYPNYHHSYGYQSYFAGAGAGYQSVGNQFGGNEASAPSGVSRNQIV